MSVPQMPTRWTRTRASPGPGFTGASTSMRRHFNGASNCNAFIAALPFSGVSILWDDERGVHDIEQRALQLQSAANGYLLAFVHLSQLAFRLSGKPAHDAVPLGW